LRCSAGRSAAAPAPIPGCRPGRLALSTGLRGTRFFYIASTPLRTEPSPVSLTGYRRCETARGAEDGAVYPTMGIHVACASQAAFGAARRPLPSPRLRSGPRLPGAMRRESRRQGRSPVSARMRGQWRDRGCPEAGTGVLCGTVGHIARSSTGRAETSERRVWRGWSCQCARQRLEFIRRGRSAEERASHSAQTLLSRTLLGLSWGGPPPEAAAHLRRWRGAPRRLRGRGRKSRATRPADAGLAYGSKRRYFAALALSLTAPTTGN
jgi:hypothetical protein